MSEISSQSFREDLAELLLVLSGKKSAHPIDATQEFLQKHPERGEGYFVMGVLSYLSGFIGDAINMIEKAHNIDPDVREYALALSSLYVKSDRLNDALYFGKLGSVLDSHPDMAGILPLDLKNFVDAVYSHADIHTHYVNALLAFNTRSFATAAAECALELKMDPRYVPALDLYAKTLMEMGDFGGAIPVLQKALHLSSDLTAQRNLYLADAISHLGLFEQAQDYIETAIESDPTSIPILAGAYYSLTLGGDNADARDAIWDKLAQAGLKEEDPYFPYTPSEDGKVRIGFLSDKCYDCFEGAVLSHFLPKIDRNVIEPFVYIQNINEDTVTQSIKNWVVSARNVFDINDKTLALIMQRDEIDVLIDMCGFGQNQRLSLMAHRPCGLRGSWLAPLHGGGQLGIDFVVTDGSTNAAQTRFLEHGQTCLQLKGPVFARKPAKGYLDPVSPPALEKGYVTFGASLDFRALSGRDGGVWAQVLKDIPDSKLRLDVGAHFSDLILARLNEIFAPLALTERIELHSSDEDERLGGFFDDVDIFLASKTEQTDTIIEALWMGVPCITRAGDHDAWLSYNGAILHAAGIPSWACGDDEAFLAVARSLALDHAELAGLRTILRKQVAQSALMNVDGFALDFQSRLAGLFFAHFQKGEQLC